MVIIMVMGLLVAHAIDGSFEVGERFMIGGIGKIFLHPTMTTRKAKENDSDLNEGLPALPGVASYTRTCLWFKSPLEFVICLHFVSPLKFILIMKRLVRKQVL